MNPAGPAYDWSVVLCEPDSEGDRYPYYITRFRGTPSEMVKLKQRLQDLSFPGDTVEVTRLPEQAKTGDEIVADYKEAFKA